METAEPTVVERLREICLALPETREEVTWGTDVNFRVRNKIFCFPGEMSMTVKVPKEALIGLLDDPRFALARYVGRFGWLTMQFVDPIDWAEVAGLVRGSYRLIAPKVLARQVQETLFLLSIPGMRDSIIEGMATPVDELEDSPD